MVFGALCFLSVLVISLSSLPTIQIIFGSRIARKHVKYSHYLFRSTSPNGHVGSYYCFEFVVSLNKTAEPSARKCPKWCSGWSSKWFMAFIQIRNPTG